MNNNKPATDDEGRDETAIWRYMDLPKFVAMLASNTQWFAKAAHLEEDCEGCNINFDLNELISAVYIGPRADRLFFQVVEAVMEKFEFKKPLQRSELLQSPKRNTTAAQ